MPYSKESLTQLIKCIDLTSLDNLDNSTSIARLIEKANHGIQDILPAAVCVYPNFGHQVKAHLKNEIKVAVVAGAFPTGQSISEAKVTEVKSAADLQIDEIDIVINRGEFLNQNYTYVLDELKQMRQACKNQKLKIILETGELKTEKLIRQAAELAIDSGADFIKTSTGKSAIGATPEAVKVMCLVIKNHFNQTGKKIGIKPSGGIKTIEDASLYYNIVGDICGEVWLTPELFRIGASSLFDALEVEMRNGN